MYFLRVFIIVEQELHCLLQCLLLLLWCVWCSLKSMCVPSFIVIGYCVSELHGHIIYVPIVMYGLRLFNVVLQELHCLPNCLHVCMMRVRGC